MLAGNFTRRTKGPGLLGSPETMLICVPFGRFAAPLVRRARRIRQSDRTVRSMVLRKAHARAGDQSRETGAMI